MKNQPFATADARTISARTTRTRTNTGGKPSATSFTQPLIEAITSNRGPWMLVEPFTRYTAGYQKEEKPERKVLSVPDESDLVYQTGVALATYNGTPVECSFWLDRDGDANVRLYVNTEQKGLLDEMLSTVLRTLPTISFKERYSMAILASFHVKEPQVKMSSWSLPSWRHSNAM